MVYSQRIMKRLKLDSILLPALLTPFIMNYSLGLNPGDTPYILFGFIFLLVIGYLVLDIYKIKISQYILLKDIVLWVMIVTVLGGSFLSAIVIRHKVAPVYQIHDIVLQQEAAIRFLLDGKNPYATTYFGTPVEEWHYDAKDTNPALYHFVMEPFYLLFALPFYFVSNHTIGFFDGRIPLLFLFFVILITAAITVKDADNRRIFLTLLAFNPALLPYTLEGRSDIFMFGFLIVSFLLFFRSHYLFSSILLALAFGIKQSAWPIAPFYVLLLYFKTKDVKKTVINILPFFITFAATILPFFFWNQKAFYDSTIGYLSGSTEHSYPITGYGFGRILFDLGYIKDIHQVYPFHVWQIIVGVPLFAALVLFLKKNPSVRTLIFIYGLFLFVYWYFSRYFHNSHLGFITMIFITAYFWPEEHEELSKKV